MINIVLITIGWIWGIGAILLALIFLLLYATYKADRSPYFSFHSAKEQEELNSYWSITLQRVALSSIWPVWFLTVSIPYIIKTYRTELTKAKKDLEDAGKDN